MALDSIGVERWSATGITPGKSLSDQLRNAISECKLCVFIATRRSIESQWCLAELGAFWGAGKTVVLFMADPDLDEGMLPPQFQGNLRATTPTQLSDAILAAGIPVKPAKGICRKIGNREQVYVECLAVIRASDIIRDTTWGRRARGLSASETLARNDYRRAIGGFIAEGKDYMELLTAEGREDFLQDSFKLKKEHPNFQCSVLPIDISGLSMVDMMIGDGSRMIFSHVSANDASRNVQYVYTESEDLIQLFLQFYSDAWRESEPIESFMTRTVNSGGKAKAKR